jgi:hypothetical protein
MKDDTRDLFRPWHRQTKSGPRNYVPPAARHKVYALRTIGHAATEQELEQQCARMRVDYMTEFLHGANSNLRNCMQRNCSYYKIYRDVWGPKGYADIFIRIKKPGEPVRWWVVDWYKP